MAQRTITVFDCSKCGKTAIPEEEVSTFELIAERDPGGLAGPRVKLDLCSVCRQEFAAFAFCGEPLTNRGARYTRTELPPARKTKSRFSATEPPVAATTPAPVPTPTMPRSATNDRKLRSNYERDSFGAFKCPDCAFTSKRPQGIGAHRAQVHGWRKANDS